MLNIKNWFLVIVSFSMFSCTWSKDSAKNEDKKQDRSIASYRKGKSARRANLKKVNIQRKGFYIKHPYFTVSLYF